MTIDPEHDPPVAMTRPFEAGHYRAVFDAVPDGIVVVDEDGIIQEVNQRLEVQFGYRRDELLGQPVELLVPEAVRSKHARHRQRYDRERYTRPMGAELELKGRRKDGTEFPAEVSLSPLDTDRGRFVISSVRDVTERIRMKRFSDSTLRATEDERLRVAQELHDDTAQRLSALLLRLRVARGVEEGERREEQLDELREDIQRCADGVRRIARGLRPPALEDAGLEAAVRAHIGGLAATTDLVMVVDADRVDVHLAADARLVLYRVVQEALSNVVRHAGADSATVRIRLEGAYVSATIEDDGVGFDPTLPDHPERGLGLMGMQERAQSVGGHVELKSTAGRGTRVRVTVPIKFEAVPHG